jgi:hypothetical protein
LDARYQRIVGQRGESLSGHIQHAERQILEISDDYGLRGDQLEAECPLGIRNVASVFMSLK